jgi:hypothetical protein
VRLADDSERYQLIEIPKFMLSEAKHLAAIRQILRRYAPQDKFNDHSVENVENIAPPLLLSGGAEDGAHGARRAALAADHFAEVRCCDFELEDGRLIAVEGVHLHTVGIVDERLGEEFD